QTHSVRAGEIIGDHEVTFYGAGDHLTFGHFAQDRSIFARGAIQAAIWLATRRGKPGMVTMENFFEELKNG
ncbi:MAG: dihydrodipicolinate reductase C-terminal domain-containing protein, partial [Bdellovibrionota bacterium]